jgi:NADPH-dependent curcumin reductase CurA
MTYQSVNPYDGLTMKGFIVSDFLDRRPQFVQEVGGYFKAGKLKNEETVVSGIEQAVPASSASLQAKKWAR